MHSVISHPKQIIMRRVSIYMHIFNVPLTILQLVCLVFKNKFHQHLFQWFSCHQVFFWVSYIYLFCTCDRRYLNFLFLSTITINVMIAENVMGKPEETHLNLQNIIHRIFFFYNSNSLEQFTYISEIFSRCTCT